MQGAGRSTPSTVADDATDPNDYTSLPSTGVYPGTSSYRKITRNAKLLTPIYTTLHLLLNISQETSFLLVQI